MSAVLGSWQHPAACESSSSVAGGRSLQPAGSRSLQNSRDGTAFTEMKISRTKFDVVARRRPHAVLKRQKILNPPFESLRASKRPWALARLPRENTANGLACQRCHWSLHKVDSGVDTGHSSLDNGSTSLRPPLVSRKECKIAQLELYDDEMQANYAWQGLLYDACYLYSMLSQEEQWSWQSMKRELLLAFYDPPELFCAIESGCDLVKSWRELQAEYWESLETSAFLECLPHDEFGLDMHNKIVTLDGEGYESNKEPSSCSDSGESLDGELKSFVLAELKDREPIHLSVKALEVKGMFEVASFFDDGVDDNVFFDSLMSEVGDDASFSSSLDTGMLENVTWMYAFQCLLKAAFVAHDDVTGVSKPLKYNIPYVGMNMVFCAEDYKEGSFMMHMHAYGKAIDGFYGTRLLCSISTGFPWEPGGCLIKLLMHRMPSGFVWDPGGKL
ncbi:hypothetical protein L7F22_031029 [Adiantum nelumboides]|nr:hypothetical protein [Adiantum nelumboides]